MKRELALRWVDALRSGEYEQTTEILKSKDGYCCLGVLCEIEPKASANDDNTTIKNYPEIGLKSPQGLLEYSPIISLAKLNDLGIGDGPLNFDEIADIIQIEYVEGL